jgi:hypothetical protein
VRLLALSCLLNPDVGVSPNQRGMDTGPLRGACADRKTWVGLPTHSAVGSTLTPMRGADRGAVAITAA